ncbi:MAG: hypothetical protein KDD60_09160, partial [Bdellovibrionales bacterium]|nr:hypothetical protein [Bdellovibrionales bacterium]
KTSPGQCGCGVSDKDSDSDGTPDCLDSCPSDARKSSAGICGCGVSDFDSDLDGTVDCLDLCPSDRDKVAPGQCGCGVADTDSDGDGALDCQETCDTDANKTEPGQCGCGVPDTDANSNGMADCLERPLQLTDLCIKPSENNPVQPPTESDPIPRADLCSTGATEVLRYQVGVGIKGNPVIEARQNTSKALGVPEETQNQNYVSLGKGGIIELGFSGKAIYDREGFDFYIAETSNGHHNKPCSSYPEYAEIFGTQDGETWHSLGTICRADLIDLGIAGLDYVTAIRIHDRTTMDTSDGYDVDGIGCIVNDESAPNGQISGDPALEDGDNGLLSMRTSRSTEENLIWTIDNPNSAPMVFQAYLSTQTLASARTYTIPANSSMNITTVALLETTLIISVDGEEVTRRTHGMNICGEDSTRIVIGGALRSGRNGKELNERMISLLEQVGLEVEILNYDTGARVVKSLLDPYLWTSGMKKGSSVKVSIIGDVKVASRPNKYRERIHTNSYGYHFSVRAGSLKRAIRKSRMRNSN